MSDAPYRELELLAFNDMIDAGFKFASPPFLNLYVQLPSMNFKAPFPAEQLLSPHVPASPVMFGNPALIWLVESEVNANL